MANEDFVSVFSSENRANIAVYPLDVFVLTDKGTAQIRGGATALPREALELLVLMDGLDFSAFFAAAGSGEETMVNARASAALKAIPVIMLTAEAKRESVMRGLAGGADGYITKPFERQVLLDGVKAVLGISA